MRGQAGARRGVRCEVRKDLQEKDERSYGRTAAAGVGGTAAAYGLPRMRMTNGLIAQGRSSTSRGTRVAATAAEGARRGAEWFTEPLGPMTVRQMSRLPEGRYLLERLPARFRASAVTLGGLGLLHASLPTKKATFRNKENS